MNRYIVGAAVLLVIVTAAFFLMGRSDTPAKVTEEHNEPEGQIELSPEQIANARINVEAAGAATIRETLPLYGVVASNGERTHDVAARFPGTIRNAIKKLGDPVKQGEVLATVESNESLQIYSITAPVAGVVTARNANPGEQTGEKVLFTVSNLSTVWVELSVFPRDATKLQVGQSVRVRRADAGLSAEGTLTYIAPIGTSASQTRAARVVLDNRQGHWVPGLYVTAEVVLGEFLVPLAVRTEALQDIEGNNSVYVRNGEGFEPRKLTLGRRDSQRTEILAGLRPGEKYATTNSFILKAESGKGSAEHGH